MEIERQVSLRVSIYNRWAPLKVQFFQIEEIGSLLKVLKLYHAYIYIYVYESFHAIYAIVY